MSDPNDEHVAASLDDVDEEVGAAWMHPHRQSDLQALAREVRELGEESERLFKLAVVGGRSRLGGVRLRAGNVAKLGHQAITKAALQPLGHQLLHLGNLGGAVMVPADQVVHIVAHIAVASVLGLLLDLILHRTGQGDIHRRHRTPPAQSDGSY